MGASSRIRQTEKLARWMALSLMAGAALGGCSTGGGDGTPYPSLPGDEPEGCQRADAYAVDGMTADLAYLASPALDGRAPGSEGDIAARTFVADRFDCLGLEPLDGMEGYEQPFTTEDDDDTGNVLAILPGSDPSVSDEVVVVSAHIDHFGDGLLGANDNASGVTALLAIAQEFSDGGYTPARSVLFAVFGAEESGFEGSEFFASNPPAGFSIDQVVYNLNMDMVGSYTESGTLYALGTFEGTLGADVVSANAASYSSLDVSYGESSDQSDNVTFCSRGVPYIFFWTEDEACYHSECDTSAHIDYASLSSIAALVGATTYDLADSEEALADEVDPESDVCDSY